MEKTCKDAGDVMVWGDNTCMVLGISTRASGRKRPFPVALIDKAAPSGLKRLLPKCKQVVASGVHTVAVTVDGDLYSWGVNDEGQLGRRIQDGDDEAPAVPGLVSLGEDAGKVTSAAATDAATFALTEGGTLYGTGVFKDDGEVAGGARLGTNRQNHNSRNHLQPRCLLNDALVPTTVIPVPSKLVTHVLLPYYELFIRFT